MAQNTQARESGLLCRSEAAAVLALVLAALLWGGGVQAQKPAAPQDPKLRDAYQRVRFENHYPVEAVEFIQATLQDLPKSVARLNELAGDELAEVRVLVAMLLGELGEAEGANGLWKLLSDKSEVVRITASGSLVQLRQNKTIPVDLSGLNDERAEVRQITVASVAGTRAKGVEEAVLPLLKDADPRVRFEAAKALGVSGTKAAIPNLAEALQDKDVMVRTAVTDSLASLGAEEAFEPLTKALHDSDWHVRATAALALAKLGQHPVVGASVADALVGRLRMDDFALVRDRAADALRFRQDEKAIQALVQGLVSEDCDVRLHVARTICLARLTPVLPALMEHTHHPDAQVREKIVEIFGVLGSHDQLPFVAEATSDPDTGVRLAAVTALRALQSRGSAGVLLAKLKDPNPHVRAATARIYGQMNDKTVCEHLLPLLKDENGYVRTAAAESLGRLGDQSAVKPLLAMLTGEFLGEARNAGEGLTIGITNAFLNSIAALTGVEQKRSTIEVLGELRAIEAVDPIVEHGLKDGDPLVRAVSAVALGKIKHQSAVTPLQNTVKDHYDLLATIPENEGVTIGIATLADSKRIEMEKQARVRASVAWALGQIADPAAEEILIKARSDRNSLVRDAADEALARIYEQRERVAARTKTPRSQP